MLCLENNFNFIQNESKEVLMMTVEKHLRVTGTSTISWKDAVVQTIAEASKTIDYLTSVTSLEERANIDGNKITAYFVDLDLT